MLRPSTVTSHRYLGSVGGSQEVKDILSMIFASSTHFEPAVDSQDEAAGSITDSVLVPHSIEASVRNVSSAPSARPMTISRSTSLVAITSTTTQE